MGSNIKENILKTLVYADIFDYPLIKEEIWRFFICEKPVSQKELEKFLVSFDSSHGFYYLKKREHIISKRKIKEKESQKKLQIAKRIASLLGFIPSVLLIGVSGNLSMKNAEKKDDIDIFVITKSGTLWGTRLLLVLFLKILGKHRGKQDRHVENKICINMLIDETAMAIPSYRRNLYTAHEVVQMKPIFERHNMYNKFIAANAWVRKFLPNTLEMKKVRYEDRKVNNIFLLEWIAKKVQLWYMKKNITTEVVSDTILAFHPMDYTGVVLRKYNERVKQYEKI